MPLEDVSQGLRPWRVLLQPRKAVESAFEFPNIVWIIALTLLPSIVTVILRLVLGIEVDFATVGIAILAGFVLLIVSAIVIGFFAKLLNKTQEKHLLGGIITSLSLLNILSIVSIVLSFLLLAASPSIVDAVKDNQAGTITSVNFTDIAGNELLESPLLLGLGLILILANFVLFLLGLYVLYLTVSKATNSTVFKNAIIAIITIAVYALVSSLIAAL